MKPMALLLMISLFILSLGLAQELQSKNERPRYLDPKYVGKNLQIDTKEGKRIKGRLDRISDAELQLTAKGRSIQCSFGNIQRIYVLHGRSVGRNMLLGGAVGAGGGAVLGTATGGDDKWLGRGAMAAGFAMVGGLIGSIVGVVSGLHQKKELVYIAAPAN